MSTLHLEVDDLDEQAVHAAIAHVQRGRILPDADGGNLAGQCLAEICRGYLDMLGHWPPNGGLRLEPESER